MKVHGESWRPVLSTGGSFELPAETIGSAAAGKPENVRAAGLRQRRMQHPLQQAYEKESMI